MARFLLIDGYNVIHEAGLARAEYGPGDLARIRHQLLVQLAQKLEFDERKRCTIVFDAIEAPPNLPGRFKHEEIVVVFAKPGHEADELIELLIAQHSAPRQLTVVSSDHRLQTAIRRRRGIAIDSDIFLKQLEASHRNAGPAPRSSAKERSDFELEFWMQEFEGISPEILHQELIDQSGSPKTEWERHIDHLQQRILDPKGLDKWLDEPPGNSRTK